MSGTGHYLTIRIHLPAWSSNYCGWIYPEIRPVCWEWTVWSRVIQTASPSLWRERSSGHEEKLLPNAAPKHRGKFGSVLWLKSLQSVAIPGFWVVEEGLEPKASQAVLFSSCCLQYSGQNRPPVAPDTHILFPSPKLEWQILTWTQDLAHGSFSLEILALTVAVI